MTQLFPDLHIEFDKRQLVFRTNIEEARVEMAAMFRHMLRDPAGEPATSLSVIGDDATIRIESADHSTFPREVFGELLPLMKDEVRLQFMRGRPDLLWMHSAAVARNDGALLISAPSGQGKSTLSTHLYALGWKFLSDDIAPVRMDEDSVIPFPQSPMRRIHPGRVIPADEIHKLAREAVDIPSGMVCTSEPHIRGIVFIRWRKGSAASLEELSPGAGALEILRNATNFYDHRGAAVERAVELVRGVPVYSLAYDLPDEGAMKLDGLWSQS